MKRTSVKKEERGVALLFALGVLALLLIVAVGFMTNSLIDRRVADNNANISQTNALAKSARNRIEASLQLYSLYPAELKSLDPKINVLEWSSFNVNTNADTDVNGDASAARDGLDALFSASSSENSDAGFVPNYAANHRPCWIYLYSGTQNDANDPRRIIGRYAFASSLPTPKFDIDNCYLSDGAPNGRVGADASEMVTSQIDNDIIGVNFPKILSSSDIKWNAYSAMTDKNGGSYSADGIRKLRKYFILKAADSPEAYRASSTPEDPVKNAELFHRFNLNRTDWDSLTVGDLLGDPIPYYEVDSDDNIISAKADTGKALPFLRQIANDKATFADIETRRRQIAANLLDYNKTANQEVSSDVDPDNWLTTAPSYTGNKRTPYLDSFAFVGRILVEGLSTPDALRTTDPKFYFQGGWIANIVSIYEAAPDKATQITLKLRNPLKFTLNKADFEVQYRYEITTTEGTVMLDRTVNKTFDNLNLSTDDFPVQIVMNADVSADKWHSGYNTTIDAPAAWKKPLADFDWKGPVLSAISDDMPTGGTLKSIRSLKIKVQKCSLPVDIKCAMLTYDGRKVDFAKLPETTSACTATGDHEVYVSSSGANTADWRNASFLFGKLYCADPRQNLNEGDWNTPEFVEGKVADFPDDFLRLTLLKPSAGTLVDPLDPANFGAYELDINYSKGIDDRNPSKAAESLAKDNESVEHPGWTSDASHLSTAYIRAGNGKDRNGTAISNSGMMSPAELGFIHRGAKWETVNISNAAGPSNTGGVSTSVFSPADLVSVSVGDSRGTSYEGGDGAILDQIKMTGKTASPGKFDVTLYDDNAADSSGRIAYRLLTEYLPLRSDYGSSKVDLNDIGRNGTDLGTASAEVFADKLNNKFLVNGESREDGKNYRSRAQVLFNKDPEQGLYNLWGHLTTAQINNKAAMGELPGKIVNLLRIGSLPDEYRIMVVTQAIRDVGGANNGTTVPIALKDSAGNNVNFNAALGRFDAAQSGSEWVYADRILGEVKEIVVYGFDSSTKRFYLKERLRIY